VVVDEGDPLVHGAKSTRHNATRHTPHVVDILLKSRVYLKDTIIFLLWFAMRPARYLFKVSK
jgi:hypothetical protein